VLVLCAEIFLGELSNGASSSCKTLPKLPLLANKDAREERNEASDTALEKLSVLRRGVFAANIN
jgi:hypothetical protein